MSMVVFHLPAKLKYSNERSTKFESLYHKEKEENGKMVAQQISPKIESSNGLGSQATNYKGLYGSLQLLQGSHLDNFSAENS